MDANNHFRPVPTCRLQHPSLISEHVLAAGPYRVRVVHLGKPVNWSTSRLNSPNSPDAEAFRSELEMVFSGLDLRNIYAPTPSFTRKEVPAHELRLSEWVGHTALHRDPNKPADMICLEPGEAAMFSPANCAIVVGVNPAGVCAFAHAGTNCLVNAEELRTAESPQTARQIPHESVMDPFLGAVSFYARIGIYGATDPRRYPFRVDHEKHGGFNRALMPYLEERHWGAAIEFCDGIPHFNAATLIQLQCRTTLGVTVLDKDVTHADPRTAHTNPTRPGRNLVIAHFLPGHYHD